MPNADWVKKVERELCTLSNESVKLTVFAVRDPAAMSADLVLGAFSLRDDTFNRTVSRPAHRARRH